LPALRRNLPLIAIAAATAALLCAGAGGYGPHRDELYFLAAGDHLAWGYPDQGPLTPLIAALCSTLAPGSLVVLRLPSALAIGATTVVAGQIARALGGSRRAELIAAASVAVGAVFLISGHLLSTTTFDLLAWALVSLLVVRAVRRGEDRPWLLAGAVLGVALLNKPLPAFLAVGLLAGVVVAGPRELLRSRWVWGGAALALAIWSPWLIWQAAEGWPQLEVAEHIAAGGSTSSEPRWAFLPFQLLLVSPLLAPVWIVGLWRLLRDPELRDVRFLAWTWIALAAVFLLSAGKPYYLAGMFPALLAAGAPSVDRWLERGRRRSRRIVAAVALAVSAAVSVVLALPILPAEKLDPVLAVNEDIGGTIGWPELARTVAEVHATAADPERTAVLTRNYGEAGAIDRYGPELGLPPAHSGHNGYWEWGPPAEDSRGVVAVGFQRAELEQAFDDCRLQARIRNEEGVENEELGKPVWLCGPPRKPWSRLWPRFRLLG